jgi:hypothetical protein
MANVTLVSTDPQEVVERVLRESVGEESAEVVAQESEVSEEGAETEAESQTAPESTEEKPSKRSQKIKRLAEKLTTAERERDEWREKFESSQRGRTEQPEKKESADPYAYPVPKPKASDFPNPQDFVEALTDWKSDEREYRNALKAQAEEAQATQREVFQEYNHRVAEARGEYEDFEKVVGQSDLKIWPEVQQALLVHENGPDIVYYLAKNPEIAEKLGEMPPARAVAEIGKIAVEMQTPSAPKAKPKPPVIHPVGGTTKVEIADRTNMSHAEWKRQRRSGQIR